MYTCAHTHKYIYIYIYIHIASRRFFSLSRSRRAAIARCRAIPLPRITYFLFFIFQKLVCIIPGSDNVKNRRRRIPLLAELGIEQYSTGSITTFATVTAVSETYESHKGTWGIRDTTWAGVGRGSRWIGRMFLLSMKGRGRKTWRDSKDSMSVFEPVVL